MGILYKIRRYSMLPSYVLFFQVLIRYPLLLSGVIYTATCNICTTREKEEGKRNIIYSTYIGESSRTLFTRTQQHLTDFSKASRETHSEDSSSWMVDHLIEKHSDLPLVDVDPREAF